MEFTDANFLRIIKDNPYDYRAVLRKIFVEGQKDGDAAYKKMNNKVFSLRRRGLAPPSGTGLGRAKKIKEAKKGMPKRANKNKVVDVEAADKNYVQNGQIEEAPTEKTPEIRVTGAKILAYLRNEVNPASYSDIFKFTGIPQATVARELGRLLSLSLVKKDKNKMWTLTENGSVIAQKLMSHTQLYQATPDDNLFYQIPMLIDHAGEVFYAENIADRANGYQGFYETLGIPKNQALEDFYKKIRVHLEDESLKNTLIQQEGAYRYKAIGDEDQFMLWRLYSMLDSVLFKSSRARKLGSSIWIYEPLLDLLKKYWKAMDQKIDNLSGDERYVIMLMLNGVQLETIVPKERVVEIRHKLMLCNIPFKIYNEGTDRETTIIEVINTKSKET